MAPPLPKPLLSALATFRSYHPNNALPDDPKALALALTRLPKNAAGEIRRVFGSIDLSVRDFRAAYSAMLAQEGTPLSQSAIREAARFAGLLQERGATIKNHPSRLRARVATSASAAPAAPAALSVTTAELPHDLRTAPEISRWLKDQGFERTRKKGSHQHWSLPGAKSLVTVPEHGAGDIKPGTLSNIRRQVAAAFASRSASSGE